MWSSRDFLADMEMSPYSMKAMLGTRGHCTERARQHATLIVTLNIRFKVITEDP